MVVTTIDLRSFSLRTRQLNLHPVHQGIVVRFLARANVGFAPILLKKSKIERRQKSRENAFVIASNAATPFGADGKVGGRFRVKRCSPSGRRARNAPVAFKNFVRRPQKGLFQHYPP